MEPYTVLMSVYEKETIDNLKQSILSVLSQTQKPSEFVIVWDGPLPKSLVEVLEEFENVYPSVFRFVKLEQRSGLGVALKNGLQACSNELVARMDSDDISVPERCTLQLECFDKNPKLTLVGGQITEFEENPNNPYAIRRVPLQLDAISCYARRRNPFNHMTVMFKKSAVLDVGNYQTCLQFEDYWLWMRMLINGLEVCNLPQILVKVRAGRSMQLRRGGLNYLKKQLDFQRMLRVNKMISMQDFVFNSLVRTGAALMPAGIRQQLYKRILRERNKKSRGERFA